MLINKQGSKTQTTWLTSYFQLIPNKKDFPKFSSGKLLHKHTPDKKGRSHYNYAPF